MNRIICFLFGHKWGKYYRIETTYPHQYAQQCRRCSRHSSPIFAESNYHVEKLISILEMIEINLRKEKSNKSKLVKIDEEISVNIDFVETIEKFGKQIKINMTSGSQFQILFNEKDWLKLHELKK